jgi:hypothetical protein
VSCSVPGSKHYKKLYDESQLTYGINTKPISDLGCFGVEGKLCRIKNQMTRINVRADTI